MRHLFLIGVTAATIAASASALTSPTLARTSVPAIMQSLFAAADANKDGFVTAAEADSARSAYVQSRDERRRRYALRHDPNALFLAMDGNKDGTVQRSEFDAYYGTLIRLHGGHAAAPKPPGASALGLRIDGARFRRGDANKDGRLSLAEAQTVGLYYFDWMDRDRNGQVSIEERRAFETARAAKASEKAK